ncbi:MAG: filamentous hemagglutinin N-terminal domain-containing protein, partial [Burkholderiaceae bacterium]|nr:filamentous hemagglutinin N-terminal domain-containing protein [Burkholderiaceae bacterium]
MQRRARWPARRRRAIPAVRAGRASALLAAAFLSVSIPGVSLRAMPTGEQVVAGSVALVRPTPQSMVIQQNSPRAIVQWQGFSIGAQESVALRQPSSASVMLNRVVGSGASAILGRLSANGQVFLVNPNGVLFGRGATVDVGGIVASTLDISNQDFLDARLHFAGSGGSVANSGTIRAADGGSVALLGAQVGNDGTISARLGTVAMAAGNRVTLDLAGDGLTRVVVSEAALDAQLRNHGLLIADGGQAVMTARAAGALVGSVVNQSGVVRARSLLERDGRIVLDAGGTARVALSGTLDATAEGA